LRRLLKYKRIGHAGTLDPLASGLLLVCLGKAVKIVQFLQDLDKEYIAEIRLGIVTDTYDSEGKILKVEEDLKLESNSIKEVISSFQGEIEQLPPIYSAIRHQGKKLYTYARKGIDVERTKRKIEIKKIDQIRIDLPFVHFRVLCSKGTYIRSLAFDIGEKLGCGAHLYSLCRTRIGHFKIEDSLTLEEIDGLSKVDEIRQHLHSIEEALSHLPAVSVDEDLAKQVKDGVEIKAKDLKVAQIHFEKGDLITIKDDCKRILAIVRALISSQEIQRARGEEKVFEYKRVLI
ncbi:MAG: tRNA pseudouridine(55) synthase TruB, partial [candidate division Zixibacteria bacterium]|nr:tRNA pseudouridine(55) synthase TruB [candidate division Zixibacteria bacterium]